MNTPTPNICSNCGAKKVREIMNDRICNCRGRVKAGENIYPVTLVSELPLKCPCCGWDLIVSLRKGKEGL